MLILSCGSLDECLGKLFAFSGLQFPLVKVWGFQNIQSTPQESLKVLAVCMTSVPTVLLWGMQVGSWLACWVWHSNQEPLQLCGFGTLPLPSESQ